MKTQGCIYTGCIVNFVDYGQTVSADVFRINDTLVIRTHPAQVGSGEPDYYTADDVELGVYSGGPTFWRPDIGVFVLQEARCHWVKNER